MFAQMAGQLFHPSTVINALRPVAEIYGERGLGRLGLERGCCAQEHLQVFCDLAIFVSFSFGAKEHDLLVSDT